MEKILFADVSFFTGTEYNEMRPAGRDTIRWMREDNIYGSEKT
jgi:hypothetical protein